MSNLSDDQRKRITRIAWAAKNGRLKEDFPNFAVADVALLAERLDELDLDERSDADPLMRWVLARLKEDRAQKADWLEDALEQVRIAELCLNEAVEAEAAVQALIDGALYRNGDRINAHWDHEVAGYYAAGLLPKREPAEPAPEKPPPVEPEPPAPPPLPPEVVKQLSEKAQKEHSVAPPEPRPPSPLADRIMAELAAMVAAHGQELDAGKIAAHLGERYDHIGPALHELAEAGRLQYIRRPDRMQYIVLPLGVKWDGPTLTEKQQALFDALTSVADKDWRAKISRGRLKEMTGINPGSLDQILGSLELKDHIRVVERGDSKTASTFLICEAARPARDEPPKTDAELIAEALAAGRVTKVGAPKSTEVH